MKERPILFSGPMVRALLDGRKTQTRRLIKPQPMTVNESTKRIETFDGPADVVFANRHCPYGVPGDRLWVRETWANDAEAQWEPEGRGAFYRADPGADEIAADCKACGIPFGWRPSIHMPRWASRLTLEITGVRVERLQEISSLDALDEGLRRFPHKGDLAYAWRDDDQHGHATATGAFRALWDSINGDPIIHRDEDGNEIGRTLVNWAANPWVWVVSFERVAQAAKVAA